MDWDLLGSFLVGLMVASLITVNPAYATHDDCGGGDDKCHVGYDYDPGAPGVNGEIYTRDPSIPDDPDRQDGFWQWVSVVIQRDPELFWVQVGYRKVEWTSPPNTLFFYVEKLDANGYHLNNQPHMFPQEDTWHSYTIAGGCCYFYSFSIDQEDTVPDKYEVEPFDYVELQAMSETESSHVNIDGTHFKDLRYYTGRSWPLWDQHGAWIDWPYSITEVSDYEFTASGGG